MRVSKKLRREVIPLLFASDAMAAEAKAKFKQSDDIYHYAQSLIAEKHERPERVLRHLREELKRVGVTKGMIT